MRIRKRPLPLTHHLPCLPALHTLSVHLPPFPTFHCNSLQDIPNNPPPTRSMSHALTFDQARNPPNPHNYDVAKEEHGFLAQRNTDLFFTMSKQFTICPGAENGSPTLFQGLEAEGQRNGGRVLSDLSGSRPVSSSPNQIADVRAEQELADTSRNQRGLDTKTSKAKILSTVWDSESEGKKDLETVQFEDGRAGGKETHQPFKSENVNRINLHIPALRAGFKGKRTCRQRRHARSLSCKRQSNGISNVWETSGTLLSDLYRIISEAGSKGLTVKEAVRILVEKGYSRLFRIDNLPCSVQVRQALKSNPSVMELKDGSFILLARSVTGKTLSREDEVTVQAVQTLDFSKLAEAEPTNGQDEVETSWKRCNRKDGRGWQCHKRCKLGASYCEHHAVKIKANHERSAKKLIARKMSKTMERSSRINSATTTAAKMTGTITASTTTVTRETTSNSNNIDSKHRSVDNENRNRGDRIWSMVATTGSSSSGIAGEATAPLAVECGGKNAMVSWKGQRKRVKARSLKSIEERAASCVVGGMRSRSSCRMALKNKSRMNGELSYNSSNTMEEGKKQKKMGGCMLNSDPKEWRSDHFFRGDG